MASPRISHKTDLTSTSCSHTVIHNITLLLQYYCGSFVFIWL
uniref:Uncharacterized protein n=1 Tax=Anguilla anguilla TaxID=7936 RepID=A0A0E9QYC8_ANGAN